MLDLHPLHLTHTLTRHHQEVHASFKRRHVGANPVVLDRSRTSAPFNVTIAQASPGTRPAQKSSDDAGFGYAEG